MDAREERGRVIAAKCPIRPRGNLWEVPSQSGNGTYLVNTKRDYCSCPDHVETGFICKHIHAVRFSLSKTEANPDGTTTTTTVTVEATVEKKTYRQDWPNYNRAQVNEHRHFQTLLADLCRTLPVPPPQRGQKPIRPSDAAFTAVMKVYSTMSARRFMGDLDEARDFGHITRVPHFNSVLKFFDTEDAAGILSDFITRSAAPLAGVESQFAVDSTGFAGARYVQWVDEKWGTPKRRVAWIKLHAMVGVKTNVVTSCRALDKDTGDTTEFPGLVASTAETFTIGEVSGDKAYLSRKNFDAVEVVGGTFYPAFKKDSTGGVGGSFAKAYHLFALNREEYGKHYHMRSNIESTFSAIKRKFGESLRSKTDRAMKNEALAKVVAHNICCVIAGMYELGIDPRLAGLPAAVETDDDGPRFLRFPTR